MSKLALNPQIKLYERDGRAMCSSLQVAEGFKKRHDVVLRAVRDAIVTLDRASNKYNCPELTSEFNRHNFVETSYRDTRSRKQPMFMLTHKGFNYIASAFTGEEAAVYKVALFNRFEALENLLREKRTLDWQHTRQLSKQTRLHETDAIKELVQYATLQGSKNAGKLYMVYSKLVKQIAGYDGRDQTSTDVLTQIIAFESILRGVINEEMSLNTHYKQIYQKAKVQLTDMKRLWDAPRLTA